MSVYGSSPIYSNSIRKCVVSLVYPGIVGCRGLRMWSTYPDIDSVRLPIPDTIGLPGYRIFRDCVSWYRLCLLVESVVGFFDMGFKGYRYFSNKYPTVPQVIDPLLFK